MTSFFLAVMEVSISISPIIAALLLLSPFINRRYAVKWKYWVWVILALRLVMPFSGADVRSAADSWFGRTHRSALDFGEDSLAGLPGQSEPRGRITVEVPARLTAPIEIPSGERGRNITLLDVAVFVWMAGSCVFILVHLFSYVHYKRQVLRRGSIVEDNEILRQVFKLKRELQIRESVRVMEYPKASSPMVIGFLDPILILPEVRYSSEEFYFILKHELIHLKRRDVYVKLLLAAVSALHWFNPLVWIMQKEAAVDMELSCDERVTQGTDYETRRAYTETLLSTLHRQCAGKTVLSTQFYGGKKIMKKRFQNILLKTNKKNGVIILACAVILAVSLGTLVGCSVTGGETGNASGQPGSGNNGQSGNGSAQDQSGQPGNGSNGQSDGSNASNAENETKVQPEEHPTSVEIMAYIHEFDGTALVFDEVEWVLVPGERAAELGLTEDDAPSGFSVYNEEQVKEEMSLASDCTCTLLDWTSNYVEMQVTPEELAYILAERDNAAIPYRLTIKENEIVGIVEQYVP